jgi:hypothetical protein
MTPKKRQVYVIQIGETLEKYSNLGKKKGGIRKVEVKEIA